VRHFEIIERLSALLFRQEIAYILERNRKLGSLLEIDQPLLTDLSTNFYLINLEGLKT
jgi:hypothetical protein